MKDDLVGHISWILLSIKYKLGKKNMNLSFGGLLLKTFLCSTCVIYGIFLSPLIQLQPTTSLSFTYSIARVFAKTLHCLVCSVPFLTITFCLTNVFYFLT